MATAPGNSTSEGEGIGIGWADPREWSRTTQVLAGCGVVTGCALAVALPFITPALRKYCIPFVPATAGQVDLVLRNVRKVGGARVADLGSGDGRVVIEAAKRGAGMAVGYEINWWLVMYSRWRAWREGVWANTAFVHGDLWKKDLSAYDAVVVFGVAEMLPLLESKLERELAPHATVVACRFGMPNWVPIASVEQSHLLSVWVYDRSSITPASGSTTHSYF